jgi:hypothetical protein
MSAHMSFFTIGQLIADGLLRPGVSAGATKAGIRAPELKKDLPEGLVDSEQHTQKHQEERNQQPVCVRHRREPTGGPEVWP